MCYTPGMDKKQIILELLQKKPHAVMATVNEKGNPEAALIGVGQTNDLTLIIGTSNKSRKYKNIMQHPNVALVIGGWEDHITIQYEGEAVELDGEEKEKLAEIYLAKTPEARVYYDLQDQRYFKIVPNWIRCTGYSEELPVFEVSF